MIKEFAGVNIPMENIPERLTERTQWVCWRYEERDGKATKVPYMSPTLPGLRPPSRASATDSLTWASFEVALKASTDFDGIGFVFSSGDPFVGIDLDNCRNPESGEIAPWAQKIITRVREGYIEVSPSGEGVHIIVTGAVRNGGSRKKVRVDGEVVGEIEMYSRERFFTITGELL